MPTTGILFYRARYYDPVIGRFLSEDPLTGAGGSKFGYVLNNPVARMDPSGLQTIVIVFWNNQQHQGFLGEHSAVFVSNDGHPVLYDPSGDAQIGGEHPTNDIFEDEFANLDEYLGAHNNQNQDTYPEVFVFDTTPEEEKEIADRIQSLGYPGAAHCAWAVSHVLHGVGPFRTLQEVRRPSSLAEQLRILEQPEILRRSIQRLTPKPPMNWEDMR